MQMFLKWKGVWELRNIKMTNSGEDGFFAQLIGKEYQVAEAFEYFGMTECFLQSVRWETSTGLLRHFAYDLLFEYKSFEVILLEYWNTAVVAFVVEFIAEILDLSWIMLTKFSHV